MSKQKTPWREPNEETSEYPDLFVHDGRVAGSITLGQSRLPVWCFLYTAMIEGWAEAEKGWPSIKDYGLTKENLASFLTNLIHVRGDFGRLLLVIANAERLEEKRADTDDIMAPSWWEDPELKAPVIELLRKCLSILTD